MKGFLDYFIVGENFRRFFDSSWKGDKYGFPKVQPIGITWLFLLAFTFPWIEILLIKLWNQKKHLLNNKWIVFILLWLFWTPLFFTFSKSLIHTYILPVLIPIALLIEYYWEQIKNKTAIVWVSLIFPVAVVIGLAISTVDNNLEKYSETDKYLLKQVDNSDTNLYYFGKKSYSSQFYSKGKIKSISAKDLQDKISKKEDFKIIIPDKSLDKIDYKIIEKLQVLFSNKKSTLYQHCH